MRRIKFLILGVCVSMSVLLTGCVVTDKIFSHQEGEAVFEDSPRFVYTDDGEINKFEIIRDKETGVLYIYYHNGYKGGISPLYDSDGKVVVEEVK